MNDTENPITIHYPKSFIIFVTICCIGNFFFSGLYFYWNMVNQSKINYYYSSLFIILILGSSWIVLNFLFYSVTITNTGIDIKNSFNRRKEVQWEDICALERPRFYFPIDVVYLTTKRGKVTLYKSMQNFDRFIKKVEENHVLNDNRPDIDRIRPK